MFSIYISSLDQSVIWPLLILLGVVVGLIGGLYGVGGFLLTPFLKVFFNLPYPVAIGCSLSIVLINSILTSYGHFKNGRVKIVLGLIMALGAIPGTELGVRLNLLLQNLNSNESSTILDIVLNSFFVILILFIIISTLLKEKNNSQTIKKGSFFQNIKYGPFINIGYIKEEFVSIWGIVLVSFIIGITTGLLGIGGGILFFPALTYLFGVSSIVAIGTTAFERIFATTYGAGRYFFEGNFDFYIMLILFVGSFIGVRLGLKFAYYLGDEKLRRSFSIILLSGILVVLYDIYTIFSN